MATMVISDSELVVGSVFYLTAVVLVASGIGKAIHPNATHRALTTAGIWRRTPRMAARILAAVEIAVGLAAIARPGPLPAILVALVYLAFAAFIWFLLTRRKGATSCGCMGKSDLPPTWLHLELNLAAAAVALVASFMMRSSLPAVLRYIGPLYGTLYAIGVGCSMLTLHALISSPHSLKLNRSRVPVRPARASERLERADVIFHAAGIPPDHPSLWGGSWGRADPTNYRRGGAE